MDLYSVGCNEKSICHYCKKSTPGCFFTSSQCLSESFYLQNILSSFGFRICHVINNTPMAICKIGIGIGIGIGIQT